MSVRIRLSRGGAKKRPFHKIVVADQRFSRDGRLMPFADPYFQGIDVIIIMLLPEDEHLKENGMILGYISEQLIEEEGFLDTLRKGDREEIKELLSRYLKKFFNQYLNKI